MSVVADNPLSPSLKLQLRIAAVPIKRARRPLRTSTYAEHGHAILVAWLNPNGSYFDMPLLTLCEDVEHISTPKWHAPPTPVSAIRSIFVRPSTDGVADTDSPSFFWWAPYPS
jgi:hypothetical protein